MKPSARVKRPNNNGFNLASQARRFLKSPLALSGRFQARISWAELMRIALDRIAISRTLFSAQTARANRMKREITDANCRY